MADGTNMKKQVTIDYLQWTAMEAPDFLDGTGLITRSPLPFYKHCRTFECGTRVFTGNVNSEKVLVQMAGRTCVRHDMVNYPGRIAMALGLGGKFTRIDLAVTVQSLRYLELFRNMVREGRVKAPRFANDEPKIITAANGDTETVYLGSLKKRSKKGLFRAYDKGKELGIEAMLTRFELEIRTKRATTAARRIVAGVKIGHLIQKVVDVPDMPWWAEIMGAEDEPLPRFEIETETDPIARRWHWLNVQVAPALGVLLAMDKKAAKGNLDNFNENVKAFYEKALRDVDEAK